MYTRTESVHGIHAGDVETSLMLHFRPDLVRMDKARNFVSSAVAMETEFAYLRPTGMQAFGWIAPDLNPHGAVGDASIATAEKGKATAAHQVAGFIRCSRTWRHSIWPGWRESERHPFSRGGTAASLRGAGAQARQPPTRTLPTIRFAHGGREIPSVAATPRRSIVAQRPRLIGERKARFLCCPFWNNRRRRDGAHKSIAAPRKMI